MAEFPYVAVPNRLKSFMGNISRLGVPDKVSGSWLRSVGYTSSNDVAIPRVLQFIDFVDASRKPTDKWMQYRSGSNSGKALAAAMKEGYAALYQIHPDAHLLSVENLKSFFRERSTAGDLAVTRTANTFKALCSLADFGESEDGKSAAKGQNAVGASVEQERFPHPHPAIQTPAPSLHIDIQIHIASDAGPEQIDQIFASMANHLYGKAADAPQ
ncbi:MAG: DUF5343 domain-containing protein [Anaerolineaceae bacterium]|nr:DUF5343 domain-containing protein [Anaerolineaceae bacterium]MDE0328910.1 DUF5343 domain-containing protein [Anaerolineaceae bacterium]